MIAAVHDRHANIASPQGLGRVQSAEPGPDNHYVGFAIMGCWHEGLEGVKKSGAVTSGVLLSFANYGDMTHVQIVGARHAVPVFQGHCILRASIEGT